jgi:hypothetical protein
MREVRTFLKIATILGLLLPFQNCGKPFQTAKVDATTSSSQCQAQLKASAPSLNLKASEFNCADFNYYGCERRIFRPEVPNLWESIKECLPGGLICVDVEVRQYHTAGAGSDKVSYIEGGEFNREEVQCFHRGLYNGISLFVGSAATLEESLALAMAACEQAVGI